MISFRISFMQLATLAYKANNVFHGLYVLSTASYDTNVSMVNT